MQKIVKTALAATALIMAVGCGKDSKNNDNGAPENFGLAPHQTGCVQGVVVDGSTGDTLPLTTPGAGIEVLVAPARLKAAPIAQTNQLKGEFLICGVPLEAEFPIFARFDGYQEFHGVIKVHSTHASQTGRAQEDVMSTVPTAVGNIRVYPKTSLTDGYKIHVHHNGAGVPGAKISFKPSGAVRGQVMNGFLSPYSTRMGPVSLETDQDGLAIIPGESLVMGASYSYKIVPPSGGSTNLQTLIGDVTVGLSTRSGASAYKLFAELELVELPLSPVSTSLGRGDFHPSGVITYKFNRPIEIVPGTLDGVTARLVDAIGATLVEDFAGNSASEQVAIAIDQTIGNTLTLTPLFDRLPDQKLEAGIKVQMNGIKVRPTEGKQRSTIIELAPLVPLFGGESPDPTTLQTVSGDQQVAGPNSPLADELVVNLKNEYNLNLAGAAIRFRVIGGGEVSQKVAITDSEGNVRVRWTLGVAGTQQLVASIDNLTATFNATIGDLTVDQGSGQEGYVGEVLRNPIVFKLVDSNRYPIGAAPVTISVDSPLGGKINLNGGDPSQVIETETDASGKVTVFWKLGSTPGEFQITARSGDLPPARVKAVAIRASLDVVGDNEFLGSPSQILDEVLKFQLLDQNGGGLGGEVVSLAITGGGSVTDTAGNSITSVTTDSAGVGYFKWKLGATGEQKLSLTFKGQSLEYTAKFVGTLQYVSGRDQRALVGAELTQALSFKLVDGSGVALEGETVRATINEPAGGTLRSGGDESETWLDLTTDSAGVAKVTWQMPEAGGIYTVSFRYDSFEVTETVSAIAQQPTTFLGSGTGTTSLSVILKDQNGDAISGVRVIFESDGDGLLSIGGGTAVNPAEGTTNSSGAVAATWTVGESGSQVTATLPDFTGIEAVQFAAPE